MRRPLCLLALCALPLGLAACGSPGTELRDPPPGATSPFPVSTTIQPPSVQPQVFTVTSPDFAPGSELGAQHTCEGEGTHPGLQWVAVPAGTEELALAVVNASDSRRVLWLVTSIDPTAGGFLAGELPEGAIERSGSTGTPGWDPPCTAEESQQLDFTLYALDAPLSIPDAATAEEVVELLQSSASSVSVMTALVSGS